MITPVEWLGDSIRLLDQTRLPLTESYLTAHDAETVAEAIRMLRVRGAPLIGIAAAYATALAAVRSPANDSPELRADVSGAIALLRSTRPTAVNLFRALDRMQGVLDRPATVHELRQALVAEALAIHQEDRGMCRRIGEFGSVLIPPSASVITHCNTGALATGGEGTALSVILTAVRQGKSVHVYADETRPLLQGARLTTWELMQSGIGVTLMTDSMAAFLMQRHRIDCCIVGADRIAANGDTANKIGTYSLAVNARHHNVPFYVAAPATTIDPAIPSGDRIPIEERHAAELTEGFGSRTAPEGVPVYSPAFDVTPASLISAIITDTGIIRPPFDFRIRPDSSVP